MLTPCWKSGTHKEVRAEEQQGRKRLVPTMAMTQSKNHLQPKSAEPEGYGDDNDDDVHQHDLYRSYFGFAFVV